MTIGETLLNKGLLKDEPDKHCDLTECNHWRKCYATAKEANIPDTKKFECKPPHV